MAISTPVGPVAVMVVQNTLLKGKLRGISAAFGAAIADTFYGVIAAFGLTIVSDFLIKHQELLKPIGGVFLLVIGLYILNKKIHKRRQISLNSGYFKSFFTTFIITISNPLTMIAFLTIFTTFGIVSEDFGISLKLLLILGVFSGSLLWWSVIIFVSRFFRHKFNIRKLTILNKIAGFIVLAFSFISFASIIIK